MTIAEEINLLTGWHSHFVNHHSHSPTAKEILDQIETRLLTLIRPMNTTENQTNGKRS